MSYSFTKLFSSITESTVWCESVATRIVWITMLAMADRHGRVLASVPGLANRARVSLEEAEAALACFLAPDRYSRSPEHEGRRIERIDSGWRLLNYAKYRALRDEEAVRESKREYMRRVRAKCEASGQPKEVEKHFHSGTRLPQAEAEAEASKSNALSGERPPDGVPACMSDPKAKARQQARESAARAIEYLNARAGTRYQGSKPHLAFIEARILKDGASEELLRAVIDAKVAEWGSDPDRKHWLSPDTLFNATKFGKYAGQLNMGMAQAAVKREPMKVYGEDETGNQHLITECSPGNPEDVARRVYTEYCSAPWMRSTRNVITRANGVQARFSVAELTK